MNGCCAGRERLIFIRKTQELHVLNPVFVFLVRNKRENFFLNLDL